MDSVFSESESSLDSAEARERAIQAGFLGFLYGYFQNMLFQEMMPMIMKYAAPILKFVDKILKKLRGDEDDGGTDELMDAADPGGFNPCLLYTSPSPRD